MLHGSVAIVLILRYNMYFENIIYCTLICKNKLSPLTSVLQVKSKKDFVVNSPYNLFSHKIMYGDTHCSLQFVTRQKFLSF